MGRKHSIRETRPGGRVPLVLRAAKLGIRSPAILFVELLGRGACIASIGCRGETEERIVRVTLRVARIARFRDGYPSEGCLGQLQPDGGWMRWGGIFPKKKRRPGERDGVSVGTFGASQSPD